MFLKGVEPEEVRLFTWEVATNYDDVPSSKDLEEAFAREFPETCSRMKESVPPRRFVAWPLISFNASEGRLSRYLVTVEEASEKGRRRLPRQIWRYGLADRTIRKMGADQVPEDNSGNYLCYGLDGDEIYLMVFFEGRLCHWLEEQLVVESGEARALAFERRVERFRRFLRADSLFSRAQAFAEVALEGGFSERLFKAAASDSFWQRRLFCDKDKASRKRGRHRDFSRSGPVYKGLVGKGLAWLVVAGALAWFGLPGKSSDCDLEDVAPVELIPAPEFVEVAEPRGNIDEKPQKSYAETPRCVLPELRVMGVIDGKLATVSLDTGLVKTRMLLAVGDSLGNYRVRSVEHGVVALECGTAVVERSVGDGAK